MFDVSDISAGAYIIAIGSPEAKGCSMKINIIH